MPAAASPSARATLSLQSDPSSDVKQMRDACSSASPMTPATPDHKLRHASTFTVRNQQPSTAIVASPTRSMALGQSERSIHRSSLDTLMADVAAHAASSSSPLKMSAKLERALHLKDKCEHELEQFCESKNRRRLHHAPASPTSCGALEGTLWLEAEKANDASAREKLALERLVRRIAPSLSNGVSSHADLLHMLHSCRECNMRVAFCSVCAERASEFFSGYTTTELLALYGRDLPPADADALAAFSNAIAARVASSTRITGDT